MWLMLSGSSPGTEGRALNEGPDTLSLAGVFLADSNRSCLSPLLPIQPGGHWLAAHSSRMHFPVKCCVQGSHWELLQESVSFGNN